MMRRNKRRRQEAVFNVLVNESRVEQMFLSPMASHFQKDGNRKKITPRKPDTIRNQLDSVTSRRPSNTSTSSNTNHSDERCKYTKQDYSSCVLGAILSENSTEAESEGSDSEALNHQSNKNTPQSIQKSFDFTTNNPVIAKRKCPSENKQGSSEASTLTDGWDISISSPTYSLRSSRKCRFTGMVDKLNGCLLWKFYAAAILPCVVCNQI